MKKNYNIKICILTILIMVLILSSKVLAATITKETLQTNMNAYASGNKKATATVSNSTITIGGDGSAEGGTVSLDDTTIRYTYQGYEMTAAYTITATEANFTVNTSTEGLSDDKALIEVTKPLVLLPLCFLGITDAQGVDSNKALYFYENAISNSSTSVDNDIFSYTMTGDEKAATYTLKVKLNADFSNISEESDSEGEIKESNEITEANEIKESNEIKIGDNTISENEIFDQNKASDKDIPDAGPEKWLPISIVAVGLTIILIIVMDIINTKRMRR